MAMPKVLELGCGEGRDTLTLLGLGLGEMTALDLSAEAVRRCQQHSSALHCLAHDLRQPLPFADDTFHVVVASLCLHYFPWPTTQAITAKIHRLLKPSGLLLCRLNSTKDEHYGAVGFPELSPHYYQVNGSPKRFFDWGDVSALFASGWHWIAVEEMQIDRYEKPKSVWEIVLSARE